LFHSQSAAGTDTEAFAFSTLPDGGIAMAQTNSGTEVATDTGLYTAVFSFLKFNCPTGEGYMHTSINDPIVSKTPVFTSLAFPSMTKISKKKPVAGKQPVNMTTAVSPVQNTTTPLMPGQNVTSGTGNDSGQVISGQLFKNALSTQVGVADNTNALGPLQTTSTASTQVGVPGKVNALSANETPSPAPGISPTITPNPGSGESLLSKPLSKQANKPFTRTLTPLVNPRKACRDDVASMDGWDRLTANALGRITIDSTYAGTTSTPTYMNPYNIIKIANQVQVSSDAMNMTHPESYLQQRFWTL
jgi:hypothetical protein